MTTTAGKHAGTDDFSGKDPSSFFLQCKAQKAGRHGAKFHVIHIQRHPTVQMYCARLIKLPHTATGGGFAGSRRRSNKYVFVNSKIAA